MPSATLTTESTAPPLKTPETENLLPVLQNDLCIGCGACAAVDPTLALHLNEEKQMYEPNGVGNADAAGVCPAVQVDYAGLQRRIFGAEAEQTPLGVIDRVYLAQSRDYDRNVKASSGGIIKEVLRELLGRGEVDGAIALQRQAGIEYGPALIRTPEEVDRLPGSIYHSTSFEPALKLLKENEGRYVLVAIPCQLEGIYTYIYKHAPHLAERIYTTIGLICGWQYTRHALKAICSYTGTPFDQLTDVTFRGGGPVGPLRLKTGEKETRVHRRVNYSYQVAFDRSFNIPRCHLCINHANFLGEIVVGDAWLPSTVGTATGISLVIARTQKASGVLRDLQDKRQITLTEVTSDEIVESQTRRVSYGDFSYAYAEYRNDIGVFVPDLIGPNRAAAHFWPRDRIARFHRENERKIRLQRQGRYRFLWYRKLTLELRPFLYRYLRWFFVRVLKVKSWIGARKEVPKSKLEGFR